MYPQIRGSQVLLAALPFTSAMCCTFPAAKKKDQNRHARTLFPLHKTKRVMSPHRCLSKEPLWLCPSKDSTSLGVFLRFPQFAPGDGPGAQQGGSFFCPPPQCRNWGNPLFLEEKASGQFHLKTSSTCGVPASKNSD